MKPLSVVGGLSIMLWVLVLSFYLGAFVTEAALNGVFDHLVR